MSQTDETTRTPFVGDGSDNSPYTGGFPLRTDTDVEVIYVTDATGVEVVKTITTDYTVSISADFSGFSVTLVTTAPATGETMLFRINAALTHIPDYANFDGSPSATWDNDFDKATQQTLTLQEQLDRTFRVAKGTPNADLPIPALSMVGKAGDVIRVNATEDALEFFTDPSLGSIPGTHADNVVPRFDGVNTADFQVSLLIIDDAGNLFTADGSAAVPAYSFTTEPDTGMYINASGDLCFATSATNAMCIDALTQDVTINNNLTVGGIIISSGGTQSFPDGTAAAPSITFTSDPDTGLYLKGTNNVGIAAGGVEVMAIGTTETVINSPGAVTDFRVSGDTLANLFFVDGSTDRVGINTATPSVLFDVNGTILGSVVRADSLQAINADPFLLISEVGEAEDQKGWRFGPTAARMIFALGDDTATSSVEWMGIERSGTDPSMVTDSIDLSATDTNILTGNLTVTVGDSTVVAGNLTVTAGDAIVTAGDLTVTAGQVLGSAGTAAAPTYAFAAKTTKGMYDLGTNVLGFSTASTEAMRIDGGQNITMASLAGTGSRTVVADANGVLSAP